MACISRKFEGSVSAPTFWLTLAAIGTADTPAEPISGFIVPPLSLFISLAKRTPEAVPILNAIKPKSIIASVSMLRKLAAVAVAPTVTPSIMVTMFISSF